MPILERKSGEGEAELRSVTTPEDLVRAREEGFLPQGGTVNLTDPSGNPVDVPWQDIDQRLSQGYGVEDYASEAGRSTQAYNEREYGEGFLNKAQTVGEHALDTLSLGIYSAALPEEEQRRFAIQEEVLPGYGIAGDVGGGVLSLAAGAGGAVGKALTATPAGLVTRGATALGKKAAASGTALARLGGAAVEAGVEGAAAGFGQANRELALLEGPVTAEKAAAIYGENIFGGTAIGAGLGVFGKAASMGMKKSGKMLSEYAERAKSGVPDAEAGSFAEQLSAYAGNKESLSDAYKAVDDSTAVREGDRAYKRALRNEAGLNEDPRKILDALRVEAQAMRRSIKNQSELLETIAKEEQSIAKAVDERLASPSATDTISLNGKSAQKYRQWHNARNPENRILGTTKALDVSTANAAAFRDAVQAGEVASERAASMGRLSERLAQNEALQKLIPDPSGRGFLGDVAARGATQLANTAITGAAATAGFAIAGPIGATIGAFAGAPIANKVTGLVNDFAAGRLSKASADLTKRVSTALDAFATGVEKTERPIRVGALQALQETSFGTKSKDTMVAQKPSKRALVTAFRERQQELLDKTEPGPDGTPQVRPEVREEMYNYLRPLQAHNPLLADQIETVMSRAMSFLAARLPKRPDMDGVVNLGKDSWQPSDWDMASWARLVRAVRNPVDVVENKLPSGQITPEDGEAFREVFPEWFNEIKADLMGRIPEMQKHGLSYKQKLALTIFTGVPMDPSFHPQVLRVLQSQFAEPGTEEGTAPMAQPNFGSLGSVKSEAFEPTPAQSRAG